MTKNGDPRSPKPRTTRAEKSLEREFWTGSDDRKAQPLAGSRAANRRAKAAVGDRRAARKDLSAGSRPGRAGSKKLSGFGSVKSPTQVRAEARVNGSVGIWGPSRPSFTRRVMSLPRGVRLAISGSVVLALVLIASVAFRGPGKVEFRLNGELVAVSSTSKTVGEALDAAGVRLGDHDRVEPPGKTPLAEGMSVTVEVANVYTLQIDDAVRTVWSTGETPEQVVDDLGVQGVPVDKARPLQSGDLIVVRQGAAAVTVIDGGKETPVTTEAVSVAQLLSEQGITLGPNDTVVPLPESELHDGLRVTVVRDFAGKLTPAPAGDVAAGTVEPTVPAADGTATDEASGDTTASAAGGTDQSAADESTTTEPAVPEPAKPQIAQHSEQVDVAFETVEQPDGNLNVGQSQVVQEGQLGRDVVHFQVTNPGPDQVVAETSRERLVDPVPRIVCVGTKAPQPVANGVSEAQLAHLRQCESGGNYSINTGNGYYGAYQFSPSTWAGLGYSGMPHEAAPAVQDEAARKLIARAGLSAWPTCA